MIQIKRGFFTVTSVNPLSSSNMTKAVMGDEQITLVWEAPAFVPFYLGDYITVEGSNWTLNKLPTVKKLSSKTWQYNAVFQSTKYELIKAMYLLFDNTDTLPSGEFPLTGTADTFMELLVANLNRVAGSAVWSVGQVIENTDYKNLTFSNEDCLSVLGRLADEFDTEYHVNNHVIHLKKISTEREITLQYGSTLYDIERSSVDSSDVVTRLYPFGSTKNLASNYRGGNSPLRLPDANGNYIENNVNLYGVIERSKTFEDIYPRLSSGGAGAITSVGDEFTFYDSQLDFNVNDYLLDGTKAKVRFNTGECAGYDFEIALYNHADKKFVIIANTQENDFTLPTADLKPAVGDKYVLIDIVMPPAYLAAAEAELLAKAQEFISQNSTPKVAYKTTFSAIYAKQNLQNVECGDTVTVYDEDMGIDEQIRIIKLQKGLTDFWTVQFDLANTVTATRLERIEGNVAAVENTVIVTNQRVNRNNLRAYQQTKELQSMVFDPDGYFDPQNIKPLSIETTMVSVSAKSQIFQLSSLLQPNYAGNPQVMQWSAGLLTHFTISDNGITEWIISQGSVTITGENQTKPLYIYARCLRSGNTGDIYLAPVALKFDEGSTYYYFLIGVLHTPISSVRGISLTYGQTTINGQFIKTGVISSIDGATYFNLNTGEIGGNIKFRSTSGALKTVDQAIDEVSAEAADMADAAQANAIAAAYEYGNGSNLLPFSDLQNGWAEFTVAGAAYDSYGVNMNADWSLNGNTNADNTEGLNTLFIRHLTTSEQVYTYAYTTAAYGGIIGGKKYIASIYAAAHRCKVELRLEFYDKNGNYISNLTGTTGQATNVDGGTQLSNYARLYVMGTAPTNAALFRFMLFKYGANTTDSYGFFCRPQLEEVDSRAIYAGAWKSYVSAAKLKQIQAQAQAAETVTNAITNNLTTIDGGLILTTLIKMLNGVSESAGMAAKTLENDIAFWGGGTLEQAMQKLTAFGVKHSGEAWFKGAIEALSGKIGLFEILAGNIIGRDTDGIEKIRMGIEDIPAISAMSSTWVNILETTPTTVTGSVSLEIASNITTVASVLNSLTKTYSFYIPYATTFKVVQNWCGAYIDEYPETPTISDYKTYTTQLILKNPNGTILNSNYVSGSNVTVYTAGWYTCEVSVTKNEFYIEIDYIQDYEGAYVDLYAHLTISSATISMQETVQKTAIGKNGFYSYFSALEHIFFKAGTGFIGRGLFDIPAGLGGASINSSGGMVTSSNWGKITGSGQISKSGNSYTITHNIGDTNYTVQIIPGNSTPGTFYYTSKTNTTIVVTCAGAFDFVLIRTK